VNQTRLGDGTSAPTLGLGTWRLNGEACTRAVATALEIGYRHIDTAEGYDNEEDVGRAIDGWPRKELFLVSKLWRQNVGRASLPDHARASLDRLRTPYLDLLLIHWPNRDIPIEESVEGFQALIEEGLIRAWGVSNFTPRHLTDALDGAERLGAARPATNQVELHPFFAQRELSELARRTGVPLTAYSPLAKGAVLDDETLRAIAAAHDASPAQVALRWATQHGHLVIPKSSGERHLQENFAIFGFELSAGEMRRIDALPQGERLVDGDWSEFDY